MYVNTIIMDEITKDCNFILDSVLVLKWIGMYSILGVGTPI